MSKFDAVIGYRAIKQELLGICDMIKNPDVYRKLGVAIAVERLEISSEAIILYILRMEESE